MIADKPRPSAEEIEALRARLIEKRRGVLNGEETEQVPDGVSPNFKFQRKQQPPQNESQFTT